MGVKVRNLKPIEDTKPGKVKRIRGIAYVAAVVNTVYPCPRDLLYALVWYLYMTCGLGLPYSVHSTAPRMAATRGDLLFHIACCAMHGP